MLYQFLAINRPEVGVYNILHKPSSYNKVGGIAHDVPRRQALGKGVIVHAAGFVIVHKTVIAAKDQFASRFPP